MELSILDKCQTTFKEKCFKITYNPYISHIYKMYNNVLCAELVTVIGLVSAYFFGLDLEGQSVINDVWGPQNNNLAFVNPSPKIIIICDLGIKTLSPMWTWFRKCTKTNT